MQRGKVVIVEGIIGVGKSTITRELGRALGDNTQILMEPDEEDGANPYLDDFYSDKPRWAFTMQMHLLAKRYKMHLRAQWHALEGGGNAVLDRSFYGDTCFARLQLANGDMNEKEFGTYQEMYHAMTASVLLPNVCVRLLVSPTTAAERIRGRMEAREGRKCEKSIDLDYLYNLDGEITSMANILKNQGVHVLEMPWDVERDSQEARLEAVRGLASRILEYHPVDGFLDLHRRTI